MTIDPDLPIAAPAPSTIVERGRARRRPSPPPAPAGAEMALADALRRGLAVRVGPDRLVCTACFRRPGADETLTLQGGVWACRGGHLRLTL